MQMFAEGSERDPGRSALSGWYFLSSVSWKLENFCPASKYCRTSVWLTELRLWTTTRSLIWETLTSCFGPDTACSGRFKGQSSLPAWAEPYCKVTWTRSLLVQAGNGKLLSIAGSKVLPACRTQVPATTTQPYRGSEKVARDSRPCSSRRASFTKTGGRLTLGIDSHLTIFCVPYYFSALGLWSQWNKQKRNWRKLRPQSARWPRPCCFSLGPGVLSPRNTQTGLSHCTVSHRGPAGTRWGVTRWCGYRLSVWPREGCWVLKRKQIQKPKNWFS